MLRRVQCKEVRPREEITVCVVLRDLKQYVRSRHVDNIFDAEQQIEFLADANVEVLHDLCRRQCTIVHGDETEGAGKFAIAGYFTAEHERKGVLPVDQ